MSPVTGKCASCGALTVVGQPGVYRICDGCGQFALVVRPEART